MIIPKKVNICGKMFDVVQNPEHGAGSFTESEMKIEIGTAYPEDVAENFIHEVAEAIMALRDYRYTPETLEPDNGDYRFFLNHKEWSIFAKDMSVALGGVNFEESWKESKKSKKTAQPKKKANE
jgi:hypothetical protein